MPVRIAGKNSLVRVFGFTDGSSSSRETRERARLSARSKSSTRKNNRSPLPGGASSGLIRKDVVRTPLVEASETVSIRVHNLTGVLMGRRRLALAKGGAW